MASKMTGDTPTTSASSFKLYRAFRRVPQRLKDLEMAMASAHGEHYSMIASLHRKQEDTNILSWTICDNADYKIFEPLLQKVHLQLASLRSHFDAVIKKLDSSLDSIHQMASEEIAVASNIRPTDLSSNKNWRDHASTSLDRLDRLHLARHKSHYISQWGVKIEMQVREQRNDGRRVNEWADEEYRMMKEAYETTGEEHEMIGNGNTTERGRVYGMMDEMETE